MSDRPKRVMILSAGVGSGHNPAAMALEAEFAGRPGVAAVQSVDVLGLTSDLFRSLQDDAYFTLVDAAPWLVGWGYDMNDVPFRNRGAMSVWDEVDLRRIARYLPSAVSLEPELRVTPHLIAHLRRRRVPADPVAMLANALGAADEVVLRLRPDPPAVPTLL